MDDTFHDMPEEATSKLPFFSGGDPGTALLHLRTVKLFIHKYCRHSQYNHEDVKIRVFGYSLKGDAVDWFRNCPEEYCLEDIINSFTDKYIKNDSPCVPSVMQNNKIDLVEDSAISRSFPDNSQDESICTMAAQTHDSGETKADCQTSVDNDKNLVSELIQMVKDIQLNQAQIIKNMELNQEKIIADHAREIGSMQCKLLALEEKHIKEMTIMKTNHEKEMNCMQNFFMAMKADNDKMIQNMEANQINLQNRINTLEESHVQEINVMENRLKMMEVTHSNQMSLQHNLSTIEERHAREMSSIQKKLEKMEQSHMQDFQPRSDLSTDHKPPSLLKQFPSHHTEVTFPIKEELTMATKDVEKHQAYVSPLTEYIQNKIGCAPGSSKVLYKEVQDEDKKSTVVSLPTSQPTQTKRKKKKGRSKWFDSSDGREQLDVWIRQSPTLCKIGHGTSEKQPTDLPESRQMLSIHYIEHI